MYKTIQDNVGIDSILETFLNIFPKEKYYKTDSYNEVRSQSVLFTILGNDDVTVIFGFQSTDKR